MCDICFYTPCHPRCPNAPELQVVFRCSDCGDEIYQGDQYIDIEGDIICSNCINNMTPTEAFALCDVKLQTAEGDNYNSDCYYD